MIRVNLQGIDPMSAHNAVVEMPAVPRVGDMIEMTPDDGCYQVRTVIWTPSEPRYDVQVRFR